MLSLKQPDGSFLVSRDSEVDVRGIYCLLCVAVMLNLVTPELIEGTAKFVAGLQTYEGGFASASHSYYIEEEEEEVVGEARDDERTGTRYNVRRHFLSALSVSPNVPLVLMVPCYLRNGRDVCRCPADRLVRSPSQGVSV